MQTEIIELVTDTPGVRHSVQAFRFGSPGGLKAYIQGALHADEVPAILVAHRLASTLERLEAEGALSGEVILVPFANPIGLAQGLLGQHLGRFDFQDGCNFNRNHLDLAVKIAPELKDVLTQDPAENTMRIRSALRSAVDALPENTAVLSLKKQLRRLAIDADIVLDLHCDSDALMHLYALSPQSALAEDLGAELGAAAILLATESGDFPFDESCSRPWLQLQTLFPDYPIDLACFAATIELRGQSDTAHLLAQADAQGICRFLARRGLLNLPIERRPEPLCRPTPLSGSEPILAPRPGVVVFHRELGDQVRAGDVIADLVDAMSGEVFPLTCASGGVLYARNATRWARPGSRLAKIAGAELNRTGPLLSP